MNISNAKSGFTYTFEVYADNERDDSGRLVTLGRRIFSDVVLNMMPDSGIQHMENVLLRGAAQVTTWYLGLFTNNYTPQPTDTMDTFPSLAGEITNYDNATRYALTFDAPVGGVISNASAPLLIEPVSEPLVVQGGFITSAAAKGATSGVLLSAVKEPSPRTVNPGEVLKVIAGLTIIPV